MVSSLEGSRLARSKVAVTGDGMRAEGEGSGEELTRLKPPGEEWAQGWSR